MTSLVDELREKLDGAALRSSDRSLVLTGGEGVLTTQGGRDDFIEAAKEGMTRQAMGAFRNVEDPGATPAPDREAVLVLKGEFGQVAATLLDLRYGGPPTAEALDAAQALREIRPAIPAAEFYEYALGVTDPVREDPPWVVAESARQLHVQLASLRGIGGDSSREPGETSFAMTGSTQAILAATDNLYDGLQTSLQSLSTVVKLESGMHDALGAYQNNGATPSALAELAKAAARLEGRPGMEDARDAALRISWLASSGVEPEKVLAVAKGALAEAFDSAIVDAAEKAHQSLQSADAAEAFGRLSQAMAGKEDSLMAITKEQKDEFGTGASDVLKIANAASKTRESEGPVMERSYRPMP